MCATCVSWLPPSSSADLANARYVGCVNDAIVAALIGAAAVVIGVLLGQSLQEFSRTRTRAVALAREMATTGSTLLDRLDATGGLTPGVWGNDYYRLGSLTLELADCCNQLSRSWWSPRSRARYREAVKSLDLLDARWAAALIKLKSGPLSESEISALILTFGGVARVLRSSTPLDFDGYLRQLRARVNYFSDHRIDADPSGVDL